MWKHYYTANSADEALRLLAQHAGHARLIAGGTDILLEMERGIRPGIDTLIDISRLPGLNQITLTDGEITLGALTTHNDVVASGLIQDHALPLAQAAWEVGAPQIRNRGTIAGNLITASPANDTITPLWALDASVTLSSVQGSRTLPFPEFYAAFRKTSLRPDEMLTSIQFQPLAANERGMFIKLGLRRAQAISVVNIAVILAIADGVIARARIALGSVAPTIIRLPAVEAFLQGKTLSPDIIREAAHLAASIPAPIDDVRSTAEYRSEMIKVLTARALRALAAGEERKLWSADVPLLRTPQPIQSIGTADAAEQPITTTINGQTITRETGQHKTLLRFLREDCGLPGTKEGCAEGECGACTVFLDGAAVMACMVPAPRAENAQITTVEGLAQENEMHPVQRAFVDAGAVQCGYCTPGFLMASAKLLEECPQPTRTQVEQSITGNLCRCTGYYKIIEAVQKAAESS